MAAKNLEGLLAKSVEPQIGRVNGREVHKSDAESGRPYWLIECVVERDGERPEFLKVRVPSAVEPAIQKYQPITFGGDFQSEPWAVGDKAGTSYRASTFTQELRPSSARPPAPAAEVKDNAKVGVSA